MTDKRPVRFNVTTLLEPEKIIANIRANTGRVPAVSVNKAIVVGGGPSAADYLEDIKAKQNRGWHLFALNGAAKWLRTQGIQADAQFIVDGNPNCASFIDLKAGPDVYLGSGVDPSVIEAMGLKRYTLVHCMMCDGAYEAIKELDPNATVLGAAPTVGCQAMNLLAVLGYKIAHCYGYDSSYQDGAHHAYEQSWNDGKKVRTFDFGGETFHTDGAMALQAEHFTASIEKWERAGLQIEVFGEGLLPTMWRAHRSIKDGGSLEDREAHKYRRMWAFDAYRKHSPGLANAIAIERILTEQEPAYTPAANLKVIDFGCGQGRLAEWLRDKLDYKVLGIDFAANALEADIPFRQANLWNLPDDIKGNFGVCCDVMEHIPPEKVDDVLANIARAVPTCVFTISFVPDRMGALIGEKLHLTVQSQAWWMQQLNQHFSKVKCYEGGLFEASNEPRSE